MNVAQQRSALGRGLSALLPSRRLLSPLSLWHVAPQRRTEARKKLESSYLSPTGAFAFADSRLYLFARRARDCAVACAHLDLTQWPPIRGLYKIKTTRGRPASANAEKRKCPPTKSDGISARRLVFSSSGDPMKLCPYHALACERDAPQTRLLLL